MSRTLHDEEPRSFIFQFRKKEREAGARWEDRGGDCPRGQKRGKDKRPTDRTGDAGNKKGGGRARGKKSQREPGEGISDKI